MKGDPWIETEVTRLIEMHGQGNGYQPIADELGRTYNSVGRKVALLRREGRIRRRKRPWTSQHSEKLKQLYEEGKTVNQIARIMRRKAGFIAWRLSEVRGSNPGARRRKTVVSKQSEGIAVSEDEKEIIWFALNHVAVGGGQVSDAAGKLMSKFE